MKIFCKACFGLLCAIFQRECATIKEMRNPLSASERPLLPAGFRFALPASPLTALYAHYRVDGRTLPLTFCVFFPRNKDALMTFSQMTKAILTDSHFLVPFFVLLAGIVLLVVLH